MNIKQLFRSVKSEIEITIEASSEVSIYSIF